MPGAGEGGVGVRHPGLPGPEQHPGHTLAAQATQRQRHWPEHRAGPLGQHPRPPGSPASWMHGRV